MNSRRPARHGPIPPPPSRRRAAWIGALLALLSLWLGGCASGGTAIGPGGLTSPFRGALVNDDQHFVCEESYDPTTGKVVVKVTHDRGSHVDDTALHEIAGVANNAIGGAKVAGAAVGALRGDYPSPIPPPLNFPACFGTQSLGYAAPPPPDPTPRMQPGPPAERPAMLEAPETAPGPSLPAPGVHRAHGHVRTVLHAQGGATGAVWYRDEDGHPHVASLREWYKWENRRP